MRKKRWSKTLQIDRLNVESRQIDNCSNREMVTRGSRWRRTESSRWRWTLGRRRETVGGTAGRCVWRFVDPRTRCSWSAAAAADCRRPPSEPSTTVESLLGWRRTRWLRRALPLSAVKHRSHVRVVFRGPTSSQKKTRYFARHLWKRVRIRRKFTTGDW